MHPGDPGQLHLCEGMQAVQDPAREQCMISSKGRMALGMHHTRAASAAPPWDVSASSHMEPAADRDDRAPADAAGAASSLEGCTAHQPEMLGQQEADKVERPGGTTKFAVQLEQLERVCVTSEVLCSLGLPNTQAAIDSMPPCQRALMRSLLLEDAQVRLLAMSPVATLLRHLNCVPACPDIADAP
jgi:hypothetical protein